MRRSPNSRATCASASRPAGRRGPIWRRWPDACATALRIDGGEDGLRFGLMYESKAQSPVPRRVFIARLLSHVSIALGLLAVSLGAGMLGYVVLEHLSWMDAFL